MTIQEWLGSDNQLGIDIWEKKYRRNNESFDEWLNRVSGGDMCVKQLIEEKKFLFGGRILSNRGVDSVEERTTYSNCYVISPPEDSIESIYDTCKKLARTYSYGGGAGVDISKLAPAGAKVHNQAKTTSGAVSFMDAFSHVTEQIGQNGRRGALMISLDCTHPDLEKFITVKSDLGKVTSANISVRVSDDFMRAVEQDADWELSFTRKETGETISKTVKAKDIFELLCKNNWNYAEPGILFWDRITNYNLLSNNPKFQYAGTNPCLTGDTLVMTTEGEIPISELVGKKPDVYCMDENGEIAIRRATKVWKTRRNAELVCVETQRGSIRCTPDHMIHTRNRGWVPASQLEHGDRITGLNRQMKDELHVAVGLTGGGYIPEHRLVAGFYYDICGKDVHHINGDTLDNTIQNLEVLSHAEHSRISNTGRVITSIRDEKGRYVKKDTKSKRYSFNQGCGVGTNWFVQDVYYLEEREDVYDMFVPDVHNFVANRMIVHNCAEEPLPAGGSCLLGALNLSEFVNEDGEFCFDIFEKSVHIAVKALNDVLEEGLSKHPLQEQRDSVSAWRQIGLGIMGLADMLIKMDIRYGSKEAVAICDKIGLLMANSALKASNDISTEKEPYAECVKNLIIETEFFKENGRNDILQERIKSTGLRNSQLLTIAPTGTISTMLGVSGGLEPIFANSYTRITKSLHGHDEAYKVYTPIVKAYMDAHGLEDDSKLPEWFVTSADISVEERIDMQAVWQKHIDASISSTVNLPNSATVEDVKEIYMSAWKKGLKGITIYRAGCEREGILTVNSEDKSKEEKGVIFDSIIPVSRKTMGTTHGSTYCKKCACGTLYITLNRDNAGNIVESFIHTSKGGICQANTTAVNRMVSLALRSGVKVDEIIDQLKGLHCPACANATAKGSKLDGMSCPDILARTLEDFSIPNKLRYEGKDAPEEVKEPTCPECGRPLIHDGGCIRCQCGWSKCI